MRRNLAPNWRVSQVAFDARLMRCYPVSSWVNHVANDDEECSRPVELAGIQNQLF